MIKKTFTGLRIIFIGAMLLNGSIVLAQTKNNQQLTNDMGTVQKSLANVEAEMKQLRRLLDNRAMLDLFQRMDELAEEVSQLRGLLEQQNHDLAGLKKRQRELYLDTDRRLRELEITATRAPAPAVSLPPVSPAAPAVESSSPAINPGTQTGVKTPAVVAPVAPGITRPASIQGSSKPRVPVSEEREAYQQAFDMLKEGRYKMADTAFREFLTRFPQSSYAGNAQYWLGESNYVTRQFEQAVKEFRAVLENYPTSNKVPDAMLKLGYTYYELRQFEQAKSVLNQLSKNYENSTASRLADKRINRMRKEGH